MLEYETDLNVLQFKHLLSFFPDDLHIRNNELTLGVYLCEWSGVYLWSVPFNITLQIYF